RHTIYTKRSTSQPFQTVHDFRMFGRRNYRNEPFDSIPRPDTCFRIEAPFLCPDSTTFHPESGIDILCLISTDQYNLDMIIGRQIPKPGQLKYRLCMNIARIFYPNYPVIGLLITINCKYIISVYRKDRTLLIRSRPTCRKQIQKKYTDKNFHSLQ